MLFRTHSQDCLFSSSNKKRKPNRCSREHLVMCPMTPRCKQLNHITSPNISSRARYLQPVQSDRELFTVKSVYESATNVLKSVNREKSRKEQALEYGPYIQYITEEEAPIPGKESIISMPYYSVSDGVLSKLYLPGHMKK